MKSTVNLFDFIDSFTGDYANNFSYQGKKALFEYLESLEQDLGEEFELDPIALCCEYTEYDSFEKIKENYDNIKTLDDLADHTTYIEVDGGGYIVQDF